MTANLSRLKCLLCQSCRVVTIRNNTVRGMAAQTASAAPTVENKDTDEAIKEKEEEENKDIDESKTDDKSLMDNAEAEDLVEPTTCCMSGCANCVWIEYAKKLSNSMENRSEDLQKIIIDKIEDPNMRAYLSFELRCRKLIH